MIVFRNELVFSFATDNMAKMIIEWHTSSISIAYDSSISPFSIHLSTHLDSMTFLQPRLSVVPPKHIRDMCRGFRSCSCSMSYRDGPYIDAGRSISIELFIYLINSPHSVCPSIKLLSSVGFADSLPHAFVVPLTWVVVVSVLFFAKMRWVLMIVMMMVS